MNRWKLLLRNQKLARLLCIIAWSISGYALLLSCQEPYNTPGVRFALAFWGCVGLLALQQVSGKRRFVQSAQSWYHRYQISTYIGVAFLLGLLGVIMVPTFLHSGEKVRACSSLSLLRRCGEALAKYHQAHHGRLPEHMQSATVYAELQPYFSKEQQDTLPLIDPASNQPLLWRRGVGGVRVKSVVHPEKLFVAYSAPYLEMGTECRSVLFLDGHVTKYSVEHFWQAWREQPELPTRHKQEQHRDHSL